jgi:hypothetical protein
MLYMIWHIDFIQAVRECLRMQRNEQANISHQCEETGYRSPVSLIYTPLSMVSLPRRNNPLVWFPYLSCLVTSFGLMKSESMIAASGECVTYRHTPRTDRVDVTLRLSSSTTVWMISYDAVSSYYLADS